MHSKPPDPYSLFQFRTYGLETYYPAFMRAKRIGDRPTGILQHLGPIHIIEYRGDEAPQRIAATTPAPLLGTICIWKPTDRLAAARGWVCIPRTPEPLALGYFDRLDEEYASRWKKSARNARGRWQRENASAYSLEEVPYEEFAAACGSSTLALKVREEELARLAYRLATDANAVMLLAARRKEDGIIGAGIAVVYEKERSASFYACGFMLDAMREDALMTALIDRWFTDALARGITVLHFGRIAPYREKKGGKESAISRFKEQFITDRAISTRAYVRFVPGRLLRAMGF